MHFDSLVLPDSLIKIIYSYNKSLFLNNWGINITNV